MRVGFPTSDTDLNIKDLNNLIHLFFSYVDKVSCLQPGGLCVFPTFVMCWNCIVSISKNNI